MKDIALWGMMKKSNHSVSKTVSLFKKANMILSHQWTIKLRCARLLCKYLKTNLIVTLSLFKKSKGIEKAKDLKLPSSLIHATPASPLLLSQSRLKLPLLHINLLISLNLDFQFQELRQLLISQGPIPGHLLSLPSIIPTCSHLLTVLKRSLCSIPPCHLSMV